MSKESQLIVSPEVSDEVCEDGHAVVHLGDDVLDEDGLGRDVGAVPRPRLRDHPHRRHHLDQRPQPPAPFPQDFVCILSA